MIGFLATVLLAIALPFVTKRRAGKAHAGNPPFHHAVIAPLHSHQLRVGAALGDAALLHQDLTHVGDGVLAMGTDEQGLAPYKLADRWREQRDAR